MAIITKGWRHNPRSLSAMSVLVDEVRLDVNLNQRANEEVVEGFFIWCSPGGPLDSALANSRSVTVVFGDGLWAKWDSSGLGKLIKERRSIASLAASARGAEVEPPEIEGPKPTRGLYVDEPAERVSVSGGIPLPSIQQIPRSIETEHAARSRRVSRAV